MECDCCCIQLKEGGRDRRGPGQIRWNWKKVTYVECNEMKQLYNSWILGRAPLVLKARHLSGCAFCRDQVCLSSQWDAQLSPYDQDCMVVEDKPIEFLCVKQSPHTREDLQLSPLQLPVITTQLSLDYYTRYIYNLDLLKRNYSLCSL